MTDFDVTKKSLNSCCNLRELDQYELVNSGASILSENVVNVLLSAGTPENGSSNNQSRRCETISSQMTWTALNPQWEGIGKKARVH